MSSEASTLLGLLADEDRLRTVAALVLGSGPATVSEVASAAGLDLRRAARALTRLANAGLVDQLGESYVLRAERFREALDSLGRPQQSDSPDSGLGPDADRILRIFVHEGKLVQIPAVHSKRLVVLDWLARLFEPGQAYPESEVNERLSAVHPDYAALRRYLVDDEFLHRRDGFYWRAGGTFDVDFVDLEGS
jgi:DNA-binding transcriptional ArsR family regulator